MYGNVLFDVGAAEVPVQFRPHLLSLLMGSRLFCLSCL